MLILKRRVNEGFEIGTGTDKATIRVIEKRDGWLYLGIDAPEHVPVRRLESKENDNRPDAK